MKYNPIISAIKTPKVVLREYLHRLPEIGFGWKFPISPEQENDIEAHLAQLSEDGICLLRAYIQDRQLARLQTAFERVLKERGDAAVDPGSAVSFNIMDLDSAFLEIATDPFLLEIIARYYRRSFGLGRADALRIEPMNLGRYGSFQWHHDARGKQVKIQVMLTDVAANGQRMTYLKQSHRQYYSYLRSRGDGSRFEADYRSHPELAARVVDVTGPAGTVGIFDTNGLHSGNRNETARRDTLTFYYPTRESHNYRPLRYRRVDFEQLSRTQQQVVTYNPLHKLID